jgi:hypothetical protein
MEKCNRLTKHKKVLVEFSHIICAIFVLNFQLSLIILSPALILA